MTLIDPAHVLVRRQDRGGPSTSTTFITPTPTPTAWETIDVLPVPNLLPDRSTARSGGPSDCAVARAFNFRLERDGFEGCCPGIKEQDVLCNARNRVSRIVVYDSYAQGQIPSSIGELTELTFLNAARNNLTGPIPSSIQSLSRLTSIDLSGNDLSGELPDMFRSMSYIALYGNRFSGPVPPLPILPSTAICELWLQKNDRNQFTCLRGDPSQHSGTCYNKLAPLNLPPCPPDLDRSLSVLFPTAVGSASAALLAIVLAVFFVRRRRRRQHAQAASATRAVTVLTREELVLPTSTGLDDDGVPFVCRGIAGGEELMLPGCQVLVDQDGLEVESLYLPGEFLHSQAECPVSPGGSDGECKQDG